MPSRRVRKFVRIVGVRVQLRTHDGCPCLCRPVDEAVEAIKRLTDEVRPQYDEMIVLRYKATNERPFLFEWVDLAATQRDYATVLTKISREYQQRF